MRYLYYIAAILVLASALIIYQLSSDKSSGQNKPAIVINDRVITEDEFAKLRHAPDESKEEFINTVITKELLIQEAQKQGIDKEEAFRRSVQNFYEQSLIKTLMDRKFASFKSDVSDEEVAKYQALLNKKVLLSVYTSDSAEDLKADKWLSEEKKLAAFGDLSREMKGAVITLKKGEKSLPIRFDDKYIVLKLDDVQSSDVKFGEVKKEEIRRLLAEDKMENEMKQWMEGLRKRAAIKVLVNGK